MDALLPDRLTRAEEDIVSLVRDKDLAAYDFGWIPLLDEISQASVVGDINDVTLAVADDVVARVSTFVDCCLSLSSAPPPSFSILDINARSPSPVHTTTSFIPDAYIWLLKNIANPYPSSEFKASLAQRHNSPVSAVSSWFANARRRMGWTALCRDFFYNCRADTVNAARHVLVKADPDHQFGPEIIHAFVAMKVAAEELYTSSMRSALTSDLDTILKDMPAEDKISSKHGTRGDLSGVESNRASEECTRTRSPRTSENILATQNYFPSPDLSHSSLVSSLDDSLTDKSETEGDVSPPLLAGRKRRLSSSEPAHVTSSLKRPRFSSSSPDTCLQPSSTNAEDDSHEQTSDSVRGTQSSACMINSRKQRLSDPYLTGTPKWPRDSPGTRLHTISDPPLSAVENEHSIDEWFQANFDALFTLPPPADVVEPDLSAQWEFELFNNYILPGNPQEASIPPIQNGQVSTSTDLTALDDLLQSLQTDGFVAPPEIVHQPTIASVPDPAPQGLPLLPDLSQSIDWTALLNDSCEFTSDSMCSYVNSTLPEIDLSISQLPQLWTTVVS